MKTASRLLVVSNRLPVTAHAGPEGVQLIASGGGLATGLRPWHEQNEGCWIGWPGDVSGFDRDQRAALDAAFRERRLVAVPLTREQIDRYYHGFSNRVLWPLFHYLIDRVPVDAAGWDAYRQVNQAFADVVTAEYRSGDIIWVHDYQLTLLPALLRARLPSARIGFFLHIPFPSSEVFRTLPWRREVLTGLLGSDLIGFHTFAYMRHFMSSLLHVEGVETDLDRVQIDDRHVRLGVFPMGVDSAGFASLAAEPDITAAAAGLRRDAGGRAIVLGVDRLDYTKGIPRRLQAIERLLTRDPSYGDRIRYVQVAVPSRGEVDSYQRFKRQVEESIGRINGAHGTLGSTPVHYVHRSVSMRELVALYSASDVMLVTPLRDGMNLVAKEFVASRIDEDGVLILSEFAGAAAELEGALVVNPYDVDVVADSIDRAIKMSAAERHARMRTLRRRVNADDVFRWANRFLERLHEVRPQRTPHLRIEPSPSLASVLLQAGRARRCRLLLDYDGTLVPIARAPELATPDPELHSLLAALVALENLRVEIVSGRPRDALEGWFGDLPIDLWAEHGFWHRPSRQERWQPAGRIDPRWPDRLLPILEQFTLGTPGSRLEVKTASVAWHFRGAQREFGTRQAHELRMLLGDALSNQPLEVLEGKSVIEVRLRGVSKAVVALRPLEDEGEVPTVAFGDDRTDEDLFRALPDTSITVAVGGSMPGARFQVNSFREVRQMLRLLVLDREPARPTGSPGLGTDA
ncbi:MAG: bifunctional alpha,alpha-trehalose-phosphate synthase (UDP-forming)/trehalose-phosphatase [Vicinamibacterales bacterium]